MFYILVTGGVISGIGKGVVASSTGVLLKGMGLNVTSIKIDPYLNIDAGTMNPTEHGEVFVLEDGGEVDLDLGCYERFLDTTLTRDHNITTGKVYQRVINKERIGYYLGKTVQVVTHVCQEIQDWITTVCHGHDVGIIELGGTVGDIESAPFVEALRQFQLNHPIFHIHVSLIPEMGHLMEQKTKPTQVSVKELRSLGLTPDVIICRSQNDISVETKQKISKFCHIPASHVVGCPNVNSIYYVPIILHTKGLHVHIAHKMGISPYCCLDVWNAYVDRYKRVQQQEAIHWVGIVGKYNNQQDSYLSILRAITHASVHLQKRVDIRWIDAENPSTDELAACHGILIPGGFGVRGTNGKIKAINYARTHNIPFFGICFGFQLAVIEFAQSILNIPDATSEEIDGDGTQVIIHMPDIDNIHKGGTMRIGKQPTSLRSNSLMHRIYNTDTIYERHRHRYEVSPEYVPLFEAQEFHFTGFSGQRQEAFEHGPIHFGVQFHPEFTSRPLSPSPLFIHFVSLL